MASKSMKRWLTKEADIVLDLLTAAAAIYKTHRVISTKASDMERRMGYRLAVIRQALALADKGCPDWRVTGLLDMHGAYFYRGALFWRVDEAAETDEAAAPETGR